MNLHAIKKHVLKNKEEILKAYAVSMERRADVAEMKVIIENAIKEVLAENEFKIMFGYDEVIGVKIIKEVDHVYFIDNELVEEYNKAFFEKIKNNKKYYDFFGLELGSYHEKMGYYEANYGYYFDADKKLVDLVRAYHINPLKRYDIELIEKELIIIGNIVKFLKKRY